MRNDREWRAHLQRVHQLMVDCEDPWERHGMLISLLREGYPVDPKLKDEIIKTVIPLVVAKSRVEDGNG